MDIISMFKITIPISLFFGIFEFLLIDVIRYKKRRDDFKYSLLRPSDLYNQIKDSYLDSIHCIDVTDSKYKMIEKDLSQYGNFLETFKFRYWCPAYIKRQVIRDRGNLLRLLKPNISETQKKINMCAIYNVIYESDIIIFSVTSIKKYFIGKYRRYKLLYGIKNKHHQ